MDEQISEKKSLWLPPEHAKKTFRAGLYLVATPIGNLKDITLRALEVLSAADVVFCEDTRVSGKLLSAYSLSKVKKIYNDHSKQEVREQIIRMVGEGKVIALVSDAGMPMISDPGYKLVCDCLEAGVYVTSLPGANAALMALQLSGLRSDCFSFIGFLPVKTQARRACLQEWKSAAERGALITYETSPRLLKALMDIQAVMPEARVCAARELTKLYEQVITKPVAELIAYYEENALPKGEIVLVIEAPPPIADSDEVIKDCLRQVMGDMRLKESVEAVVLQTGAPKKRVYTLALEVKDESA